MPKSSSGRADLRMLASFLGALAVALPVGAQQHAHTHGRMALDVAVDAQSITLAIESPLDGFLGFERAPRTDAERRRVSDLVARLKAADRLFQPDPAAACKLSKVALDSAVLGLDAAGEKEEHGYRHGLAGGNGNGHDHGDDEHADIDVDIVFSCANAPQARFIDVRLFEAFERIRTIDAQVASPQGQFRRTLRQGASRLSLTR